LNLHKRIARFVIDSEFLVGIDISDTFPLYIECKPYKLDVYSEVCRPLGSRPHSPRYTDTIHFRWLVSK